MKMAMVFCIAVACLAFCARAFAGPSPVQSADIVYERFMGSSRLLEIPGELPTDAIGLKLLISPISPLYWDNRVHALAVGPKVRWVGWEYELGFRFSVLDIFFHHHSEHALDRGHPLNNPVSNAVAVRWRIYP